MNQLDVNGRNAVVTGGASGLGFAIAERLVASGAKVVIWDLDSEAGDAAAKKLGASSIAADVSDPASVGSALQKTLRIMPAIDIFINNAGISDLTPSCGSIRSRTGRKYSRSTSR